MDYFPFALSPCSTGRTLRQRDRIVERALRAKKHFNDLTYAIKPFAERESGLSSTGILPICAGLRSGDQDDGKGL
jgi:hypothetical protein